MSTSETVVIDKGPCPCGAGHIAQHVTTQDNPWSDADIFYSIECALCRKEWRLEHSTLVNHASETSYVAAAEKNTMAYQSLRAPVDKIVSDYFVRLAAPSKKAEHTEMTRLGICTMSYRQYLDRRRKGETASETCNGLRNEQWLLSQAASESRRSEIQSLIAAYRAAKNESNEASKQIVRRRIA